MMSYYINMEKIIFRVSRKELQRQEGKFVKDIMERAKTTPLEDLEREIAERRFREPIVIFDRLAIRPFWRDGKNVPALPLSEIAGPYASSHV